MSMTILKSALVGASILSAGAASAATFTSNLGALNAGVEGDGLDVTGRAELTLEGSILDVRITASGLVPNERHFQHIHGVIGGVSRTPTLADDAAGDNDGVVELLDGLPAYGPIILSLTYLSGAEAGMFPLADAAGNINFSETYDLEDGSIYDADFTMADLLPLDTREVVLHGGFLAEGVGMPFDRPIDEADGTAGYKDLLPVAAGTIAPIPLPAAAWMLIAALGSLVGLRRLRIT